MIGDSGREDQQVGHPLDLDQVALGDDAGVGSAASDSACSSGSLPSRSVWAAAVAVDVVVRCRRRSARPRAGQGAGTRRPGSAGAGRRRCTCDAAASARAAPRRAPPTRRHRHGHPRRCRSICASAGAERPRSAGTAASSWPASASVTLERSPPTWRLELVGGAGGDDLAVVDHRDPVGEPVGLLEVLGGQQQRGAAADQLGDARSHMPSRLRGSRPGGRLVQEQHRRRRPPARRRGRAGGACRRSSP